MINRMLIFCLLFCRVGGAIESSITVDDPTRPLNFSAKSADSQGSGLSAILYDKQRKWVIIDGQLYKEGDKVGKCVVQTIQPHAVIEECPEGLATLNLLPFSIKQS